MPVVLAAYVGLSMPQYGWIATILPLVIVLGAPFTFVVGGFAGPRLGRAVAARFTRTPNIRTVHSNDTAHVQVNESVTVTPPSASLSTGTSAPKVLLVSASDDIKVKVQGTLNTCEVTVASTSAQAVWHLQSKPTRRVIFDASAAGNIPDIQEVLKVAESRADLFATTVLFLMEFKEPDTHTWEARQRLQEQLRRYVNLLGQSRIREPRGAEGRNPPISTIE